jgi:hypothetical protein
MPVCSHTTIAKKEFMQKKESKKGMFNKRSFNNHKNISFYSNYASFIEEIFQDRLNIPSRGCFRKYSVA